MIKATIGNNVRRNAVMIDENTTLRSALEQAGIDYSIGMTSLDGSTLQPGDLDKTFADFGITEKCFLLNVVKADNAAAITVHGGVAVLESSKKLADIKKVSKYRPEALCLFDGTGKDKEVTFAVGVSPKGNGSVNQYGVSFGTATTADGKATVTMTIPEGTADPKKWVMEAVGTAILNLNKVEAQFSGAISEIDEEISAIESNIAVL